MAKRVIIKPIITEKMTDQAESLNRYGFIVDRRANKQEIRNEVEKLYGVKVDSVNTLNVGGGKPKMRYTTKGVAYQRAKAIKKAVVTVAEGDVIDFYSNI